MSERVSSATRARPRRQRLAMRALVARIAAGAAAATLAVWGGLLLQLLAGNDPALGTGAGAAAPGPAMTTPQPAEADPALAPVITRTS